MRSSQRSIENTAEKYHFFYSDQSQVVFPGQETGMEAGLGCSHAQNQGVDGQAVSQELRVRLLRRAGLRVHRKVPSVETQQWNEGTGVSFSENLLKTNIPFSFFFFNQNSIFRYQKWCDSKYPCNYFTWITSKKLPE